MERFSNQFLERNRRELAAYARHWVKDPLHQWSRQWEYPYVEQKLLARFEPTDGREVRLLDAGSGLTFFPSWLAERLPRAFIECCDSDATSVETGTRLHHGAGDRIRYRAAQIQSLPYADRSFDAVYCISVLEHTRNYAEVVREFRRVLAPGGCLIVTFDISPDGRSEIDVAGARGLLAALEQHFQTVDAPGSDELEEQLARPRPLSTGYAKATRPELVPWQRTLRSTLGTLVRGRLPRPVFFELVICCGVWAARG
jgi:SAM-dependent methyltransferase